MNTPRQAPRKRDLTPAQARVLSKFMEFGKPDEDIADDLNISVETVRKHIKDAKYRLNLPGATRVGLALWLERNEVIAA